MYSCVAMKYQEKRSGFTDSELYRLRELNFKNRLGRNPRDQAIISFRKENNIPIGQPIHHAVTSFIELILSAANHLKQPLISELHAANIAVRENKTPYVLENIVVEIAAVENRLSQGSKNFTGTYLHQQAIEQVIHNIPKIKEQI